jgi:hypothetical protein
MKPSRAWVLLKSGRRLDLLDPDPDAWTDRDLAIGLSRTYRWAGYSAWDLPLSVAQHSLNVLALGEMQGPLTAREALRELLHDATEALLGGIDPIFPIKPHLGEAFRALDSRLQSAVDRRYDLPPWSEDEFARHKQADRLAAACEAFHVVGWSRAEMKTDLGLEIDPLEDDPLPPPAGMTTWEPWPPKLAEQIFLNCLNQLLEQADAEKAGASKGPANAARKLRAIIATARARQLPERAPLFAPGAGKSPLPFEIEIRPATPRRVPLAADSTPPSAAGSRPLSEGIPDEEVEARLRTLRDHMTANKVPMPKPIK